MKRIVQIAMWGLCLAALGAPVRGADWLHESKQARDARMEWWREARFGMFIHWGLYAVPAGVWKGKEIGGIGEWIMNSANIPRKEYEQLAKQFNPVKYNPDEWVRIAKNAGVKYIVITSKHHDGFCLFNTKATDYNVVKATPYGKDVLKMLAEACRRQGIKFCVYYSIMDWHHPSQLPGSARGYNPTKIAPGRKAEYIAYMKQQLKELVEQYDPGILWFDGGWPSWFTAEDGAKIYNYVRSLKPSIIINNRLQGVGDYGTPEQHIPATGLPGVDWETCMTMNNTWGYKLHDNNWKSPKTLIRNLVDIASKGGNYLLNVGPTAEGLIPQASVERLAAMGKWMKVNGEAIYGTSASPFKRLPWGRCTQKRIGDRTRLFLHVFDWPRDGELLVPGLLNEPLAAWLLSDPSRRPLRVERTDLGLVIRVPSKAPDPICSVIALDVPGKPEVIPTAATQGADGAVRLAAADARLHGRQLRYESGKGHDNIGYWLNPKEWAEWTFRVTQPGLFAVEAVGASLETPAFVVACNGAELKAACPKTGDYSKYVEFPVGELEIGAPGLYSLSVRPVEEGWTPLNLRSLTLKLVR
ncbi:MAG: alpha-L-fucosidase [Verrucomicrobia bacterium]|nr:alpha-L-fucosidase [Verrucomicrobiota bacterium]